MSNINYRVIAVSQCEEIEGSQILGIFETELKALQFELDHKKEYWQLETEKICKHCQENLDECYCEE